LYCATRRNAISAGRGEGRRRARSRDQESDGHEHHWTRKKSPRARKPRLRLIPALVVAPLVLGAYMSSPAARTRRRPVPPARARRRIRRRPPPRNPQLPLLPLPPTIAPRPTGSRLIMRAPPPSPPAAGGDGTLPPHHRCAAYRALELEQDGRNDHMFESIVGLKYANPVTPHGLSIMMASPNPSANATARPCRCSPRRCPARRSATISPRPRPRSPISTACDRADQCIDAHRSGPDLGQRLHRRRHRLFFAP